MEYFIFYIIIPFVAIAFLRSLLGKTESPRTTAPASSPDPDGTGCLTPMVLVAVILGILWFT